MLGSDTCSEAPLPQPRRPHKHRSGAWPEDGAQAGAASAYLSLGGHREISCFFPFLDSSVSFSGWKILLINQKKSGRLFSDGCGLSARIHFASLFNLYIFVFPRKFFFWGGGVFLCFCFFFSFPLNLDISPALGRGLSLRFKCRWAAGRGQREGLRRGFYYLPLPRAWKSGLSSKNSFLA